MSDELGLPNTSTNIYFQDEDFIQSKVEQFKADVRAGKLCTVDMKPYMKDQRWKNYIDNIRFMPNRIKAAERAAASFVQTVFTQGLGFPISIIILRNITCSWRILHSIKRSYKRPLPG